MIIFRNKYIPFLGYKAMNLFGILFVKKKATISDTLINHESIHTELMKELLFIGFYLIYMIEWIWRYFFTKDKYTHKAYRNMSFEKEAYAHENDLDYIKSRKHYALWRK